jgi:hypothetical protein
MTQRSVIEDEEKLKELVEKKKWHGFFSSNDEAWILEVLKYYIEREKERK